jgi:rubrerythrin
MMVSVIKVSAIAISISTATMAVAGELTSAGTRQELLSAMKEESFDHLKYTLYAEQAKKNGNTEAAAAFERVAAAEHNHFKGHAKYFGLVRSDAENLKDVAYADEYVEPSGNRQDLLKAMKEEAFEYLKYLLYADQARKNGNNSALAVFERMAAFERTANDKDNFTRQATNFGLVGSDARNLEDAIAGENLEATKSYPGMASRAKAAGDAEVAEHFANVAKDEAGHEDAFKAVAFKRNSQ